MDPLLKKAILAAVGFSYPVLLGYAKETTPFQFYVGTAVVGIAYCSLMARFGFLEVGTMTTWSAFIIFICGVLGAFGFLNYLQVLGSPMHVGIALSLGQILIVLGCTICHVKGGLGSLTTTQLLGLTLTSLGVYLLNSK